MEKYYLWKTITIASFFHFLFPFGIGYLLKDKWKYGIAIIVLFELVENLSGFTITILNFDIFSAEPLINIISDLVIGTIGLFAGYKVRNYFKSTKRGK
jgi:hypothetical protein